MGSSVSTSDVHQKLIWRIFINYFSKINRFKMVPRWSWRSWTPSATSTSWTILSTASTSYVHQKFKWHMFISYFSKTNRFKTIPPWYRVIKRPSTPSATSSSSTMGSSASTTYVHQKLTWCLYAIFQRQIDLSGPGVIQGYQSRCSWTPSATSSCGTYFNSIFQR